MSNVETPALAEGHRIEFVHAFTAQDVDAFARVSGDTNPLHMDSAFARSSGFRDRVVHGALLAALVSRVVGMELPTQDTVLLNATLHFAAPTYIGDMLSVEAIVTSLHPAANAITLKLRFTCSGELRARGSAMVRLDPTAMNV